jgi:metallophosphoesterase (TIGR00282 family)
MKTQVFRLLALGDVVGEESTRFLQVKLPRFRQEHRLDLVIANGENSSPRGGIDPLSAQTLFSAGVDIITTGNHVFRQRDIYDFLDGAASLLRPCNYPDSCPGRGYGVYRFLGWRVLVINVQGTLFMESLASPFETVEKILSREEGKYDFALCDFHGEATSEKAAFAHLFDSRISAVFGTHTHVPTADARVLPGGTGFITDLGMCGGVDSVLGMKKEIAIEKFLSHMPTRYQVASGPVEAQGSIFSIDPETGRCLEVEPVVIRE